MDVSDFTIAARSVSLSAYPDEGQRAGYLALGLLLVLAALIGLQLFLMPSALFAFCATLCFVQLSPKTLRWFQTTRSMRRIIQAWRATNAVPVVFRCALLSLIVLICLVGLAFEPHLLALELVINVLFCAVVLLFMGPQDRRMTSDTE